MAPRDIILDTDIGDDIDDALAIAYAIRSPEVNLRAVTTVFGNVEMRTRLALKLLDTYQRADIPVATGLGKPLLGPRVDRTPNQTSVLSPGEKLPEPARQSAVDLILSTAMGSEQELTVVAVGALTNVAAALVKEPALVQKARFVVMGGVVGQQKAEYNISCDPEAARILFDSEARITMVGLDVTTRCHLSGEDVLQIRDHGSPTTDLLYRMIQAWQGERSYYPVLHDPLAVAVAFDPSFVETTTRSVRVELRGEFTRGFTVPSDKGPGKVEVCANVDAPRFVASFMERLLGDPPRG